MREYVSPPRQPGQITLESLTVEGCTHDRQTAGRRTVRYEVDGVRMQRFECGRCGHVFYEARG